MHFFWLKDVEHFNQLIVVLNENCDYINQSIQLIELIDDMSVLLLHIFFAEKKVWLHDDPTVQLSGTTFFIGRIPPFFSQNREYTVVLIDQCEWEELRNWCTA